MKNSRFTLLVYGLLVLIGGIIGHIKANSTASLIAGILFGTALITCGIASLKKGLLFIYIGAGLTLFLAFFFAYRFLNSLHFMPAGMMTLLSICALIILFFDNFCLKRVEKTQR